MLSLMDIISSFFLSKKTATKLYYKVAPNISDLKSKSEPTKSTADTKTMKQFYEGSDGKTKQISSHEQR